MCVCRGNERGGEKEQGERTLIEWGQRGKGEWEE